MAYDFGSLTTVRDRKPNASVVQSYLKPAVRIEEVPSGRLTDLASCRGQAVDFIPHAPTRLRVRPPSPRIAELRGGPHASLVVLQTWEGYVSDVGDETFSAKLADLTDEANLTPEVVEFSLDDVDPDDRELVRLGGVFRWIIGYREQPFGRRERVSSLVFRRLPCWTAEDLARAESESQAMADAFQWD
jgi:hypothetical protein